MLPRQNQIISDTASAFAASFCVAPFITVIDRSIIQNASGAKPLRQGLTEGFIEVFTKPHRFVQRPEFLMIWALYYVTYVLLLYSIFANDDCPICFII